MRSRITVLIAATIGIVVSVRAGDLTPPNGAIEPTMKTLTEVEPRTAIRAADMPKNIMSPGSYYLVENIATAGNGIAISSDNVTLDLMGFTLSGGTGSGITVVSTRRNITIKNGIVRGWAQSGIMANNASDSHFQDLILANNGTVPNNDRGLGTGNTCVVSNCTAVENGSDGFWLGNANIVTNCVARGNGRFGIHLSSGTVRNCTARNNVNSGIRSSQGAVIEGCTASGSTTLHGIQAGNGTIVRNCITENNAGSGIVGPIGGEVRDCQSRDNGADGIQASGNSTIIGNNCNNNAVGINVLGRRCRIESNNVEQNGTGIGGVGIKNIIIKNTSARNGTNYDIAADNAVGEIIDVSATAGVPITSGNPWANFIFEAAVP